MSIVEYNTWDYNRRYYISYTYIEKRFILNLIFSLS